MNARLMPSWTRPVRDIKGSSTNFQRRVRLSGYQHRFTRLALFFMGNDSLTLYPMWLNYDRHNW